MFGVGRVLRMDKCVLGMRGFVAGGFRYGGEGNLKFSFCYGGAADFVIPGVICYGSQRTGAISSAFSGAVGSGAPAAVFFFVLAIFLCVWLVIQSGACPSLARVRSCGRGL